MLTVLVAAGSVQFVVVVAIVAVVVLQFVSVLRSVAIPSSKDKFHPYCCMKWDLDSLPRTSGWKIRPNS